MKRRKRLGQISLKQGEANKLLRETAGRCKKTLESAEKTTDPDLRVMLAWHANACFDAVTGITTDLTVIRSRKKGSISKKDKKELEKLLKEAEEGRVDSHMLALEKRLPKVLEKQERKTRKTRSA